MTGLKRIEHKQRLWPLGAAIEMLTRRLIKFSKERARKIEDGSRMPTLGKLLCGTSTVAGTAKAAFHQLSTSINDFSSRTIKFLGEPSAQDSRTLGPFCARVVLENGCAALVGRLDTFRILYLSEFQSQPEYDLTKRARSAFSWTGDVISNENRPVTLWNAEYDIHKISRALFSHHLDHLCWKPAVEQMLDFVGSQPSDPNFADILEYDAESFIPRVRGKSTQLYSALSKGVHWEFFTTSLTIDAATVETLLRDTLCLVGHLGLVSHFIPTAYASLPPKEALDSYLAFRKLVS